MSMKYKAMIILLFSCALLNVSLQATSIIQGNDTTKPFGFAQEVTTKTYDRSTGFFFVGLADGGGSFAISRAQRPDFSSTNKFTAIGSNDLLSGMEIEFLTNAAQCDAPPILGAVVESDDEAFLATTVIGLSYNGTTVDESESLNDAVQDLANLAVTSGIVNIAASCNHIFAAVRPTPDQGNPQDYGLPASGISLIQIVKNTDHTFASLQVKDAQTGKDGNRAQFLDEASPEIGTIGFTFSLADLDKNKVALFYDCILDRLFVGVRIVTGNNATDIGRSVVVGQVDSTDNNKLVFRPIVDESAVSVIDNIIAIEGATESLGALNIRVMHSTPGPDYLIVNGGIGETVDIGNELYALPLVNDPCNPTIHGTLANVSSELQENIHGKLVFTQPATAPLELYNSGERPALVGDSELPIEPDQQISDIVVVDDTVYVSLALTPTCDTSANDTGIFYSQAQFGNDGKIISWTPWTKRATPFNAFPGVTLPNGSCHNGAVQFFDVDAKTGNIWIVEGSSCKLVGVTSWSTGILCNDLISQVRAALCDGSYSSLDLDQSTNGFLNNTIHRYALFGGVNKVVFARISHACLIDEENSSQTVIQNFSCPENFLVTELPSESGNPCPLISGCVQALQYSRNEANVDNGYFFAGTQQGLFAFSVDGNGFNPSQLTTLDQPPFTTGSWQKIENIPGSVIAIKSSGLSLYVLTQESTCTDPFKSTLYSILFEDTLQKMFEVNNIDIIAQTGVGIFSNVLSFNGIQIVATGDPDDIVTVKQKEQLVLATNQGLFLSRADQNPERGIANATNQTEANWTKIQPALGAFMFSNVFGIDTQPQQTVWPVSVQDPGFLMRFDRSSVHQFSVQGDPNNATNPPLFNGFIPEPFNAVDSCSFKTLDPINYFFSDGARRFFLLNRTHDCSTKINVAALPFDTYQWSLNQFDILDHPVLAKEQRFYWMHTIGVSGYVMAGTNCGVIGLQ